MPITKLIENVAKTRAQFEEISNSKEAHSARGRPISGSLSNSDLVTQAKSSKGGSHPLVLSKSNHKHQENNAHALNIKTTMNIEVMGPNHLRLIDDVDPPDKSTQ
ncbi:hypothetical protein SESBI_45614, partial [Sesbania bispinosa]